MKNKNLFSNLLIAWGGLIIIYIVPIIITLITKRSELVIFQQSSDETYLNSRAYFILAIMILLPVGLALFNIFQGIMIKKAPKNNNSKFTFYLQIVSLVYIAGLYLILPKNLASYYHLIVLVLPLTIIFLTYNKSTKKKQL